MADKLDLKVGFACNNHCDFCIQGDKRIHYPQRDFKTLYVEMKKAREEDNVRDICITGGEPTVHTDIIKIIATAKKLGFTNIQVQSNGMKFGDPQFFFSLLKAGITEFAPSIHGSTAQMHDDLVKCEGAFDRGIRGLELMKKFSQRVLMNTVITNKNYKDIPAIAKLLVSYDVKQIQFAFVHIGGTAWKNKDWLVPKKSDCLPYVKEGLDIARAAGITCMVEAVPYCLMKGYEDCVAEDYMPDARIFDANGLMESYKDYKLNSGKGKAKREACKNCKYFTRCEGPWHEYPDMFGWDEFIPVID